MPEPFLESVEVRDGLFLSWIPTSLETRAFLLAFAEDNEFTVNRHIFVTPLVSQAQIRIGTGNWYVRVGACEGSEVQGTVGWSGIQGPFHVEGPVLSPSTYQIPVLHHKPIDRGVRFYTGKAEPHIVLFEMGIASDVGTRFAAGPTRWKWFKESGAMGWVDCWGMNYPETYAVRMSSFEAPGFPTSVCRLGPGRIFPRLVCARVPFRQGSELQNARGDAILIHQRKVEPNLRFTSHSDYLRYQAAIARTSDVKERTVGPAHFSAVEHGSLT